MTYVHLFRRGAIAIADYLSPPSCLGCKKVGTWLCRACNLELGVPPELVCPSCLAAEAHGKRCEACRALTVPLQQLASAYRYESRTFHRLLAAYKERGLRQVLPILVARLSMQLQEHVLSPTQATPRLSPIVTAIPCSTRRRRERGFDQAELLARAVAKKLHLEYRAGILIRAKQTGVQKELGQLARRTQLKGVYNVSREQADLAACQERGVLLIDDVATSLATLETCAMLLGSAGIRDVRAGVLAHAAIG